MAAEDVLGQGEFIEQLLVSVPEVEPEVREHFDDKGELLLHLLMTDLLRAAVRFFHAGELEVEQRLLHFIGSALRQGDAMVENAVQVSFIEHAGAFPEETPAFLASWPPELRAELRRGRNA
ncbi:hypothetical protein [Cellulosimicrobium sp. RS]|uniref:DUF7674 family protein n=1 Tax=Cellulosimicrobium sp. RS TaxID=3381347 RepID=UPI0038FCE1D5